MAESQRIEALDVVRGFALFGILLMNVEWFNRPLTTLNEGMPHGLTGPELVGELVRRLLCAG